MSVNYKGRDYKLYLATTTPASAALSTSYTVVGKLLEVSISTSRNAIDVSAKSDGDNSEFIAGRRSTTLTGSARFSHTVDSGQAKLYTALAAEAGEIWFLVSDNTTTGEEFHAKGILTQYDVAFPDDDSSTVSFTIQVTGAITQVNGQSTT